MNKLSPRKRIKNWFRNRMTPDGVVPVEDGESLKSFARRLLSDGTPEQSQAAGAWLR